MSTPGDVLAKLKEAHLLMQGSTDEWDRAVLLLQECAEEALPLQPAVPTFVCTDIHLTQRHAAEAGPGQPDRRQEIADRLGDVVRRFERVIEDEDDEDELEEDGPTPGCTPPARHFFR